MVNITYGGNAIMKKAIVTVVLVVLFASSAIAATGNAPESKPSVDRTVLLNVSTGAFLPNEGDLDLGLLVGIGFESKTPVETIFGDVYFAFNEANITLVSSGSIDSLIAQLGYMTNFKYFKRLRLGLGLQYHKMELSNIFSFNKMTGFSVAEYEFSKRWLARIQASADIEDESSNTSFGGYVFTVIRTL